MKRSGIFLSNKKLKLLKIQEEVIKKNSVSILTRRGGEKNKRMKKMLFLGNRI